MNRDEIHCAACNRYQLVDVGVRTCPRCGAQGRKIATHDLTPKVLPPTTREGERHRRIGGNLVACTHRPR